MGAGCWDRDAWADYAQRHVHGRRREEVFSSRRMDPEFDPARISVRESRDSEDNPVSTPIILASDVTGSMGMIAHELMAHGLNTLATEIYERRPVSDPHVMVMAVGDAKTDAAPLQATQFEADIRIADQVRRLWLEGGGGGNGGESYSAAHAFAGLCTDTDSLRLRGKKGYMFTIGDEPVHDGLSRGEMARIFGGRAERGLSARECLRLAQEGYDVFHIVVMEGYAATGLDQVLRTWKPLLPERVLLLDDHRRLAEVVVSAIQVAEGASPDAVAGSWTHDASSTVARALRDMRPGARGGFFRRLMG
jgi:hypothetical protein